MRLAPCKICIVFEVKMLIDALENIRIRNGWTDFRMAKELGIHHSTYSLLKYRKYDPGRKVLKSIVKRFPDLKGEVSLFLSTDVQICQGAMRMNTKPSQRLSDLAQGASKAFQVLRHMFSVRFQKRG